MSGVHRLLGAFCAVMALSGVVLAIAVTKVHAQSTAKCPTGFANFGDSLTDTGNLVNAFPYAVAAENPPYGETFFGKPAKRFSNGRLVPDFFCEFPTGKVYMSALAFRKPLLDGYFTTTSFDYEFGVNFAVAGANAAERADAAVPLSVVPVQINQFIRFKKSVNATLQEGLVCGNFNRNLPIGNPYPNWLFTIEAGGNDIVGSLTTNGYHPATIISSVIPTTVGNISLAIETLYAQSARNFLIFDVPAQGCSPYIFTLLGNLSLPVDNMGCIIAVNDLVQIFNVELLQAVEGLRKSLPGVTISLFDYYGANIEILRHPASYGFNPNLSMIACCGGPGLGDFNYNPVITCGHPALGSNNCANPDEYISWDGMHYTDNFYRTISLFALSGKFTNQGINYTELCNLDFSKFGPKVKYHQAYPSMCNNLFA